MTVIEVEVLGRDLLGFLSMKIELEEKNAA